MRKCILLILAILIYSSFFNGCKGKSQPPPAERSSAHVHVSRLDEAETLKKILERDPENVKALIKLGNIYFDAGQNSKAVDAYKKALNLDPDNTNVRTDMAICLRRLKRTDEAIGEFRRAIESDPRHYQSRYNLGLVLLHDKNDLQGAINAWEDLLKEVPDFPGRDRLALQIEALKQIKTSNGTEEPSSLAK